MRVKRSFRVSKDCIERSLKYNPLDQRGDSFFGVEVGEGHMVQDCGWVVVSKKALECLSGEKLAEFNNWIKCTP